MKKTAFIALIALLMISTAAYAANKAPAASDVSAVQQKFESAKSRHLQRIDASLAKLQKAQSCVQAAADFNSLEGCDSPRYKSYHKRSFRKDGDAPASDSGK